METSREAPDGMSLRIAVEHAIRAKQEADRAEGARMVACEQLHEVTDALWGNLRGATRFLKVMDGPAYAIRWDDEGTITIDLLPPATIMVTEGI